MTRLAEVVDVVIGVDTHVYSQSAAAVDTRTGAVLGEITVPATAAGYDQLTGFADEHAALRAGLLGRPDGFNRFSCEITDLPRVFV